MKSNYYVCEQFANGLSAYNRNMSSTGDRLWSYSTVIAEYIGNDTLIVNFTKYSTSTSKHRGILLSLLDYLYGNNIRVIKVTDVPRDFDGSLVSILQGEH